jgi:hypothetical protein
MSMMVSPQALDPRTRYDIRVRQGKCGCHTTGKGRGRWSVCDYHEGYDAALEQHGFLEDGSEEIE